VSKEIVLFPVVFLVFFFVVAAAFDLHEQFIGEQ